MAARRQPNIGELWRTTAAVMIGGSAGWTHAGQMVTVIGQKEGIVGQEFHVVTEGGAGWISEHCSLWEPVDEAG